MNILQLKHRQFERRWYSDTGNRRLILAGVFLLLALLLSSGNSGAQITTSRGNALYHVQARVRLRRTEPAQQMTQIASQADNLLSHEASQQQFSGTVLIARNGQVLLDKGYSMANWSPQIPNTPDTRFYLGSTSKQFTAMAILLLQQQGKLHIQNSICAAISPCPSEWHSVTLHDILTHTSGIQDLDDSSLLGTSPQDWIESYKGIPLAFTPGSQFSYCSICYQILGYVVERVSGESYSDFLQQEIFDPLQMNDSGTGDSNYTSVPNHATGYAGWQDVDGTSGMNVDPQWSFLFGSGLVYSTTEDMYRWDQALMHGTLVSQETLHEAFTPHIASQYAESSYGYGWFIEQEEGHRLIWHDGKIPGFRTYSGFFPDSGLTLVILSNLAPVDEITLAGRLEKIMLAHTR